MLWIFWYKKHKNWIYVTRDMTFWIKAYRISLFWFETTWYLVWNFADAHTYRRKTIVLEINDSQTLKRLLKKIFLTTNSKHRAAKFYLVRFEDKIKVRRWLYKNGKMQKRNDKEGEICENTIWEDCILPAIKHIW